MQLALQWLETGAIKKGDKEVFKLQVKHKHQILKKYFAEVGVEKNLKLELMEISLAQTSLTLQRTRG